MNIVVVEDSLPTLHLLGAMLSQYDSVRLCGLLTSPSQVLSLSDSVCPDAAFLDVELPEMNGIELACRLRLKYPAIQIVFVTAHTTYAVSAFDVEAVDYLLKPVESSALARSIERIEKAQARLPVPLLADPTGTAANRGNLGQSMRFPVQIKLFGGFEVRDRENKRVRWPARKDEELLAYLFLSEQPVSKWILIDLLWPESDEKKGEKNFNMAIYQIRHVIDLHQLAFDLEVDKGRYRIVIGPDAMFDLHLVRQVALGRQLSDDSQVNELEIAYHACSQDFLAGSDYRWFWKFCNAILTLQQQVIARYWQRYLELGQKAKAIEIMRRAQHQFADDDVMQSLITKAIASCQS